MLELLDSILAPRRRSMPFTVRHGTPLFFKSKVKVGTNEGSCFERQIRISYHLLRISANGWNHLRGNSTLCPISCEWWASCIQHYWNKVSRKSNLCPVPRRGSENKPKCPHPFLTDLGIWVCQALPVCKPCKPILVWLLHNARQNHWRLQYPCLPPCANYYSTSWRRVQIC